MYYPQDFKDFSGLVFDMDGTLADSMPAHFAVWEEITRKYELPFDESTFYSLGGVPTFQTIEILADRAGKTVNTSQIAIEKENLFALKADEIIPRAHTLSIVRYWAGKKPIALATGAGRDLAERVLTSFGIRDAFSVLVCAEDVAAHKPDPEVFLEAARGLGIEPSLLVAFEDTDIGAQSAQAAGMTVVDVRAPHWA